ncbi:MAG TPA: agmatinase family protein [Saprospiraceae bacterium]|nr:agmatinase family protein [Saprospiraceae bacterium]
MPLDNFDPNGPGLDNGNFIGLPFTEEEAALVFFPVPWDVTVSYTDGTAGGPANILQASTQLDLAHPFSADAWKKGIFFKPLNTYWVKRSQELRPRAEAYIQFLEQGGQVADDRKMNKILEEINYTCENLHRWVEQETYKLLQKEKAIGLIGGEHSCPLGFLRALAKKHGDFGILQIDAHLDLRKAYEGFTYSHASIFYNTLQIEAVQQLTQVGIRDYCDEEVARSEEDERIEVFYDYALRRSIFRGSNWQEQCEAIVATLPEKVYISFDIDGLQPSLCPHTGTPVPGGLSYNEALFLIETVIESSRTIIGFDLCEVAGPPHEWDGNVGARIAYALAMAMLGK